MKKPTLNSLKTIDRVVIGGKKEDPLLSFTEEKIVVNKIQPSSVPPPPPPEKKFDYDDILSTMGMKVVNGKIELFSKDLKEKHWNPYMTAPSYEKVSINQKTNQAAFANRKPNFVPKTLPQRIFRENLFKQRQNRPIPYKGQQPVSFQEQNRSHVQNENEGAIPDDNDKEREDQLMKQIQLKRIRYVQYLVYLQRMKQWNQINQIKSKKLLFNNPHVNISISRGSPFVNPPTKLFRFVGVKH